MMKKIIRKLGITLMVLSLLVSMTRVTSLANECNDPFSVLEQHGFEVVTTSRSSYSLNTLDADNTETNLLFDQQSFVDALSSHSESLNEIIHNGNIVAVFDDSNEMHGYEEALGLCLGFEDVETIEEDTHKTVGYIYQADDLGGIHISRVNTESDIYSEEEGKKDFVDILLNYEMKNSSNGIQARTALNTKFLGSVTDYYTGSSKKGDVSVVYEVYTAQEVSNYDYYVVHAYIDATPGDSLYGNKYDADLLTTSLKTTTSGATLYKTGPNTLTGTNSYTVNVGFSGSQNGISGTAGFSWSGNIPVVDIAKNVKSSSECGWEVDIDDWDSAADSTLSFEPGGTFRVSESNNKLTVFGYTTFTVDAWDESPSTAVSDGTLFYCTSSSVE